MQTEVSKIIVEYLKICFLTQPPPLLCRFVPIPAVVLFLL